MNYSNNAALLIEAFEANKLTGYLCPAGVPTISRGLTAPALKAAGAQINYRDGTKSQIVRVGLSITSKESDRLFGAVLDYFASRLTKLLAKKTGVEQSEFDALLSIMWNIGEQALKNSTLLKKYIKGDNAGAAEQFAAWTKATVNGRKVTVAGLVRRRNAECALFENDARQAYALAAIASGPMPQAVDTPTRRVGLLSSTELPAAGGLGVGGILTLWSDWKDAAMDVVTDPKMLFIGFAILLAAFWFWKRWTRLRSEHDTGAADAVELQEPATWDGQQSLDFAARKPGA